MVDKVDIISAPSKFSVQTQQKVPKPAAKPEENESRKVDWKTIGIAGAALAAIVGGIILVKRGNASKAAKTVSNAGSQAGKAGETTTTAASHTASAAETATTAASHTASAAETATTAASHTASATETTPPVDPEKALKDLFEKYKDKFMTVDKLSFENFKDIINSPEFETLMKMRVNVIKDNLLQCKLVTDRLAGVFGENYPKSIFEQTLRSTKEDVIKDIAERNYFLACDKHVVNAVDANYNPIRYENGIAITPHFAQINPMTNKLEIIPSSAFTISSDGNGRYICKRDELNGFFEFINPKNISRKTPKSTHVFGKQGYFKLLENGDTNQLFVCPNGEKRILMLEYNPESKQIYDSKIINSDDKSSIVIPKTNVMSEIAEIFDFAKLSEKDYMSTLKDMVSSVINKVE